RNDFERDYHIVRSYQEKELHEDHQLQFTKIDIEASFLSSEEIMEKAEGMMKQVMKDVHGINMTEAFDRMSYDEAMYRFGSDKPDTRFGMELIHVTDILKDSSFKVFSGPASSGGKVCLLNVKGNTYEFTITDIDGEL